jgi:signal transduction histidine kinase
MRAGRRAVGSLVTTMIAAGLVLTAPVAAQKPIKRVLAIHGGPESYPGNARFDAALRETLLAAPRIAVDYYAEYLETEEFGESANTSLRDYIAAKFRDRRIDVVIVNTRPAVDFVLRYRAELFPGVPMVFVATGPPEGLLRGEVSGVTGLVRDLAHTETLELALKLQPRTKRVHVIGYAPGVEGYQERLASGLARAAHGVTLTYANEPTLAEALATVRGLPADSLIFYTRYSPVSADRVMLLDEVIAQISKASPVPIYSSSDNNLGRGAVGGMMRSELEIAARLGEMTLQILEGTKPEDIPIKSALLAPMFDWRELQRWRIDESRLPPGSEIRFRVPTVWGLYGAYIAGATVVVVAQLLLIAGLLHSRSRLRRADTTIRAREAALRTSYDRIRQMAGRLINAQETARAEIARDLHDDVCQRLTSVSMGVGSLKRATGPLEDPKMQEEIFELDRETRDAYESIRRLSHDLHPATLRLLGLAPALRSHCHEIANRHGGQVQFSGGDDIGALHPDVAVCFFRVAQESLRNSVLHGGAKHMTVTLGRLGEELDLTVVDDGQGFDVTAVRSNGGGLGLVTMEERVNLVGGHLSIVSVPGQGTTVRVRGPVSPHPLN